MANGSILYVAAGHDIPEVLLEKLLTEFPTCTGAAFIVNEDEVYIQQNASKDIPTLKEMRKTSKDYDMFLSFHKFDGEFHEDDYQPYIVLANDEDQPILVVMMEGDFSKHALENSNRTPAYFALINHIQPRIEQFFRLSKKDLNIVLEEIMKDNIKQEFADLVLDRGTIVMIPGKGQAIEFIIANEQRFEGEWGWVTNSCGYKEGVDTVEEVKLSTKDMLKAALSKKKIIKKKEEEPTITQVGATKVIFPSEPKEVPPMVSSSGPFLAAPPKGLSHNKTKEWYEVNFGSRPKEWHKLPLVPILPSRINAVKKSQGFPIDGKTVKTFTAIGQAMGLKPSTDAPEKEQKTKSPDVTDITVDTFVKNVEPEHIKSSPVLPAKSLDMFNKEFMSNPLTQKWMQGIPPTIEELLTIEKKLPNFYEQTGLQLDNLMTEAQIMDIVYKHPDVAVLLLRTVLVQLAMTKAEKGLEELFTEAAKPKKPIIKKSS